MAQDLPQASDADSRADLPLNSQTISQMTSAEIYKKNRQRHEGTFMDRSWKYKLGDATEEMMQDGLTFKEKFWMGAYTYQGIINRFQYRLNTKQEKVQFLEDILNRKDQYEERDQLLIKQMERKVMRAYDGMRWPIMALVFAWAIGNASNTNRHFLVRFGPAAVLLPFLSMYNNYIGMYGVHKQIDGLLKEVLDSDLADNESKIRAEVSTFLQEKQRIFDQRVAEIKQRRFEGEQSLKK